MGVYTHKVYMVNQSESKTKMIVINSPDSSLSSLNIFLSSIKAKFIPQ